MSTVGQQHSQDFLKSIYLQTFYLWVQSRCSLLSKKESLVSFQRTLLNHFKPILARKFKLLTKQFCGHFTKIRLNPTTSYRRALNRQSTVMWLLCLLWNVFGYLIPNVSKSITNLQSAQHHQKFPTHNTRKRWTQKKLRNQVKVNVELRRRLQTSVKRRHLTTRFTCACGEA